MSMGPTAQRIAIFEACGWENIRCNEDGHIIGNRPNSWEPVLLVADHLNDLNAMHEAEATLGPMGMQKMAETLLDMVTVPRFHATAAQRAEAFLRTVGKWEDDR